MRDYAKVVAGRRYEGVEGSAIAVLVVGSLLGLVGIGGFITYCKLLVVVEAWMQFHRF